MTGVDPIVFAYGLYLGGYLAELGRQADAMMGAGPRADDTTWLKNIVRPLFWPVFFMATVVLAILRA